MKNSLIKKDKIRSLIGEVLIRTIIAEELDITNNKELLELFIPILRSDFRMLENYVYKNKKDKIQCDISVLSGKEDDITQEEILAWKNHGDKEFKVHNVEGVHFFINTNS